MDQYPSSNVRMPRACKRGRPSQRGTKPTRRGRRSKEAMIEEMMQQSNCQYGSQQTRHDMAASYSMQQSRNMQQVQRHMQQSAYNSAYSNADPRIRATAEREQSSRYYTRTQANVRTSNYMQTDQQNMGQQRQMAANQVLYPNMSVPRTTTYSVPEQLPELANMKAPAQPSCRYNTRSSVHNTSMPLASTPNTVSTSMNSIPRPCTRSYSSSIQQMNSQAPMTVPVTSTEPQKGNNKNQTDFVLTEDEQKLLRLLKAKKLDPDKLDIKMEDGELNVTYYESNTRSDVLRTLETGSNLFKQSLLRMLQSTIGPVLVQRQLHTNGTDQVTPGFVQLPCIQDARFESISPAEETEPNSGNVASNAIASTSSTQSQVSQSQQTSQPITLPEIFQSLPIPTIYTQNVYNFGRQNQQAPGIPLSIRGPNFNIPLNLSANFANFLDPSLLNYPLPENQSDYSGWY